MSTQGEIILEEFPFQQVSEPVVTLEERWGSDLKSVNMMRKSTDNRESMLSEKNMRRIWEGIAHRHASPFEHSGMTVYAEVPKPVAWEWMRHRTQAYSEMSTRYIKFSTGAEGNMAFYVPDDAHMRLQPKKVGDYGEFELALPKVAEQARQLMLLSYEACSNVYEDLIEMGIAREVARGVIPVNFITKFYASASLRNWLNFLNLRTDAHALQEFRDAANMVEHLVATEFPVAYEAWCNYGRLPVGLEDKF